MTEERVTAQGVHAGISGHCIYRHALILIKPEQRKKSKDFHDLCCTKTA